MAVIRFYDSQLRTSNMIAQTAIANSLTNIMGQIGNPVVVNKKQWTVLSKSISMESNEILDVVIVPFDNDPKHLNAIKNSEGIWNTI